MFWNNEEVSRVAVVVASSMRMNIPLLLSSDMAEFLVELISYRTSGPKILQTSMQFAFTFV